MYYKATRIGKRTKGKRGSDHDKCWRHNKIAENRPRALVWAAGNSSARSANGSEIELDSEWMRSARESGRSASLLLLTARFRGARTASKTPFSAEKRAKPLICLDLLWSDPDLSPNPSLESNTVATECG